MQYNQGIIERYRDRLPISKDAKIITLNEGSTPLIKLHRINNIIGKEVDIYVKYEGLNPTGSFKDRGMSVAVTQAVSERSQAIICASTGNTSASASAYAARANIRAIVLIPEVKVAMGKLAQAMIQGATVIQIEGNFDHGMKIVKQISQESMPITIVNSINPYRLQGQKTAAFEVVDVLGKAPDYHYLPVGNAGNITAYWIGYNEYAAQDTQACQFCHGECQFKHASKIDKLPIMVGYQAQGAAPFIHNKMIDDPDTIATAIRIGHPQSWDSAWKVQQESKGWFDQCSDEEILHAQKLLAQYEGIFCEPASAISVAGALRDIKNAKVPEHSCIVCTLTGHGLKDPDIAIQQSSKPPIKVKADLKSVEKAILQNYD